MNFQTPTPFLADSAAGTTFGAFLVFDGDGLGEAVVARGVGGRLRTGAGALVDSTAARAGGDWSAW